MQYSSLNVSKVFNHIFYQNDVIEANSQYNQKNIYGIPHVNNILCTNKKESNREVFGVPFLSASDNDIFDNVMNDGQVINIQKQRIDAIAFLGFSEMGTVCDDVILYSNDKKIFIPLILKTFHTDKFKGIDDIGKNANCKLAFYLDGNDGQKHGVFFWQFNLTNQTSIDAIELPVNCSMHIMGITLLIDNPQITC